MATPDIILIGGHAYRWQELCELRRQQLEASQAAQPRQLALFELKDDCRPASERTAAERYQEPTLFSLISESADSQAPRTHAARPNKRYLLIDKTTTHAGDSRRERLI